MLNPYLEFEYWLNDVPGAGTGDAGMTGVAAAVTSVVGAVETGDGVLLKVVGSIHPAARSVITIHTRNNADKKYDGSVFPFIYTSNFFIKYYNR